MSPRSGKNSVLTDPRDGGDGNDGDGCHMRSTNTALRADKKVLSIVIFFRDFFVERQYFDY